MRILFLAIGLLSGAAMAQDRAGNDTPGEWRVDHFASYGLWDVACDWRETNGQREERCYARYVDVVAPRPRFAAIFSFIQPAPDGHRISFGIEPGTVFDPDGFRIDWDGQTVWRFAGDLCLRGGECIFEGARADELTAALSPTEGVDGSLVLLFRDRHGVNHAREWDLGQMQAVLADLDRSAAKRSLLSKPD